MNDKKYIDIIELNPIPGKEILEIKFKAKQFIQNHIENFGKEFEGFNNKITKIIIEWWYNIITYNAFSKKGPKICFRTFFHVQI